MDDNTPLQGTLLLETRLELVTSGTVTGTFYGAAFSLYCFYAISLVPQFRSRNSPGRAKFMFAYTTVIMLLGLLNLASNAWITNDAYIGHSDFPGGPLAYGYAVLATQPVFIACNAAQLAINILTSAIQVWRVWVIWSATKYANFAIIPPLLCFLSFSVLQIRSNVLSATRITPGEFHSQDAQTQLAQIALQAATTILATALIASCLIYKRWRQRKLMGSENQFSSPYLNIVAILVESYAIESTWTLLLLLRLEDPVASSFFGDTQCYIEIIAYLLVQYRVSSRRAYDSQQKVNRVSTLRWNHTTPSGGMSEFDTRPLPPMVPSENETSHPKVTA